MGQTLKIAPGFDRTWRSVLLASDGTPTPYPNGGAWDAAVFRGAGEPALFAPDVAWVDQSAATYEVTIPANRTTGLDAGVYWFRIGLTAGGVRSEVFDGFLEVKPGPGPGTLRVPYVTYKDLLDFFDQLGTLQTVAGDDATFLRQRSKASDMFDRDLVVRYAPRAGFVKTRGTAPDPILGDFDVPDPTATVPTPKAVSDAIGAGGVIVDENVREVVSKLAVARILDRQEVMGQSRNPFEAKADQFRADAMQLWKKYDVQLDTDDDGVADMLIGRDVVLLPSGTAP